MKGFFQIIVLILIAKCVFLPQQIMAQAPASFKYQAVLRDARGNIRSNTATTIIISILQGSATGTAIYSETHSATTDGYGLINLEIGKGKATIGTFSGINWGTSTYFVKVTVDGVEMGTSQLLSVPYALYANNAGNGFSGSYSDLIGKPILFDGTWLSLTSKPTFATIATSGSYNDLTNKPILFNGSWASLTGKPTLSLVATTGSYTNLTNLPTLATGTVTSVTGISPITVTSGSTTPVVSMVQASGTTNGYLSSTDWTKFNNISSFEGTWSSLLGKPNTVAGFGITDAISTTHPANGITSTNISNWNTAYGWGNHLGLYRPITYVPEWSEISNNPFSFVSPANNQLLKYNTTSTKFENWTPNFLTSYTEIDPSWTTASGNYYTKTDMQTSGTSQLHFNNLINNPTTVAGYGITDAVSTTGNQTIAGNKIFTGTINVSNNGIINVASPVNASDAANKSYVDGLKQQIKILEDNLIAAGTYKMIDIDGNQYNVVKIGTQVWMKENLKTTKYNNGDLVGTSTPTTLDISLETNPKYQWAYDGNESNVATYGRLYTWYAAIDSRGICPTGWHVPTDDEWSALIIYLGGEFVAGGKLKETGTTHWQSPNMGATNETDFTALPSGYRYYIGTFDLIGFSTGLWSATENSVTSVWFRAINTNESRVYRLNYDYKRVGFPIRCLRD